MLRSRPAYIGDAVNSPIRNSGQIYIGPNIFQMFFTMLAVELGPDGGPVSPSKWRNRLKCRKR
jgi:hypothetical protein